MATGYQSACSFPSLLHKISSLRAAFHHSCTGCVLFSIVLAQDISCCSPSFLQQYSSMARTSRYQDSSNCTWILSGSQVDDDNIIIGPILNYPTSTGDLSKFLSQLDENILPAVPPPPPLTNSTDLLAELISRLEDDPPTAAATCTVATTSTEIQDH